MKDPTYTRTVVPKEVGGHRNPFKGLSYFVEEDQGSFGGRDKDIRTVAAGVLKNRTFLLYGRSGLGKTSLLRAGVFPELSQHQCRPVYVRALVDPVADLRLALHQQLGGDPEDDMHTLIDNADNEGPVVIVFDQFEEFFLRFPRHPDLRIAPPVRQRMEERRRALVRQLGTLARASELNVRLVFSLREDWVAGMKDLEGELPDVLEGAHRLEPLTAFGVRQAVLQGLRASGCAFDPALISALVEELAEVNFDPAVLQVLCSEVWRKAALRTPADREIFLEPQDMTQLGGIHGIFAGYLRELDGEVEDSGLRTRIQTRGILNALITDRHTKQAVPKAHFREQAFDITEAELSQILNLLRRHRLVRRDRRGEESWYELIHERLIETIEAWLEEGAEYFHFRSARRLVENSCAHLDWRNNPGLLLHREQLDETVGPFKELVRFTEEQHLFLLSSAIYSGSQDLEHWAQRAGDAASTEGVSRFLEDPENTKGRRRAAAAAGRLTTERKAFAQRCRELSLRDPDAELRRIAGRSFGRLAGTEEWRALGAELQQGWPWWASRKRALDTLADVLEEGTVPDPELIPRRHVRAARRRLAKRRLEAHGKTVRNRGFLGALFAAVGSLVWILTAGPLLSWALATEVDPSLRSAWSEWIVVLLFLVPLPYGLWGLGVGRGMARQAGGRGQEGTFFAPLPGGRLSWISGLLLVAALPLLFLVGLLMEDLTGCGLLLVPLVLTLAVIAAFCAAVGALSWLAKSWLWRPARPLWWTVAGLWGWSLLGTVLLAPLWGGLYLWLDGAWTVGIIALGWLGLFTALLAQWGSSPAWGGFPERYRLGEIPAISPQSSRRSHRVLLLSLVAIAALVFWGVGYDGLLKRPQVVRLAAVQDQELPLDFAHAPFDLAWVRLVPPGDRQELVRLQAPGQVVFLANGKGLRDGQVLLLPPQGVVAAVRRQAGRAPRIQLVGQELALQPERWQARSILRLVAVETGRWQGELHFEANTPQAMDNRVILVEVATGIRIPRKFTNWCRDSALDLHIGRGGGDREENGEEPGLDDRISLSCFTGDGVPRLEERIVLDVAKLRPAGGQAVSVPVSLTLESGGGAQAPEEITLDLRAGLWFPYLVGNDKLQDPQSPRMVRWLEGERENLTGLEADLVDQIRRSSLTTEDIQRRVAVQELLAPLDLQRFAEEQGISDPEEQSRLRRIWDQRYTQERERLDQQLRLDPERIQRLLQERPRLQLEAAKLRQASRPTGYRSSLKRDLFEIREALQQVETLLGQSDRDGPSESE